MPGTSDTRPTVVFLSHWARGVGGAELSLLDIMRHCRGRARMVLLTSQRGELVERAREAGVECRVFPLRHELGGVSRWNLAAGLVRSLPALWCYGGFLRAVRRAVRELDPAAIHANVPKSHLLLPLIGGKRTVKQIVHVREIFARGSLAWRLYALLFGSPRTTIVCISQAVRDALPVPLARRGVVLHNGVSVEALPRPLPAAPLRFLYLGRIVPWKGIHELIDMFAEVITCEEGRGTTLSLVGDTRFWDLSYRASLQQRINALSLASCCELLPHTESPREVLGRHAVFVCAAHREPFGRSVAEAQACSLPVIAWRSGGIPEIVQHAVTGILVPQGDRRGFCAAMLDLCRNPGRAVAMGAAGRERMQRLFAIGTRMEAVWECILKDSSRPPQVHRDVHD